MPTESRGIKECRVLSSLCSVWFGEVAVIRAGDKCCTCWLPNIISSLIGALHTVVRNQTER